MPEHSAALVDLHAVVLTLLEITPALGTLVVMRSALLLSALLIEPGAPLLHEIGIELREIFVFVPAWFLFDRHTLL